MEDNLSFSSVAAKQCNTLAIELTSIINLNVFICKLSQQPEF